MSRTFFGTDGYSYPFLGAAKEEAGEKPTAAVYNHLPKPELWTLVVQLVLSLVVLICAAVLAGFQAEWLGSPSGLSGFLLFVALLSLLMAGLLLLLLTLVRTFSLRHFVQLIRQRRSGCILRGIPAAFVLFAAIAQTVSTGIARYCSDHSVNSSKLKQGKAREAYLHVLGNFCAAKIAATIFLWFLLAAWGVNLVLFWAASRGELSESREPEGDLPIQTTVVPLRAEEDRTKPTSGYSFDHAGELTYDPGELKYDSDDEEAEYAYFARRYGSPALRAT